MSIGKYEGFIPQNTAPYSARRIVLYNLNNKRVGNFGLQNLTVPAVGKKLYSFLCASDSHVKETTETEDGTADLIRALKYAENDADIAFTTLCGDVIDSGSDYYFEKFKTIKNKYTTKPVYAISGNHEANQTNGYVSDAQTQASFGHPLYYSFTHGNDVFIMLGEYGWTQYPPFTEGELQFLYETLEANRNKRCFVFFHVFSFEDGDSGQPTSTFYDGDIFALSNNSETRQKQKKCFIDLLKHYKNAVWFHGHSHAKFQLQEISDTTVYSEKCGYRSVHIPSLAKPKDYVNGSAVTVVEESQGYIVDVYENQVILCGRDFAKGVFLPIATYCLDTTLVNVEANTFVDSTGIITK